MERGVILENIPREIDGESCLGGEIIRRLERRDDLAAQFEIRLFEIVDGYVNDLFGVSFDPEVGKADVVRIADEQARESVGLQGIMAVFLGSS